MGSTLRTVRVQRRGHRYWCGRSDAINPNFANAVGMVMAEGGSGTFTVGETVTGGTTNTTAEVKSWDPATRTHPINRSGRFSSGETMTGDTSSAVVNVHL